MRSLPPRMQSTILPATTAGSSAFGWHCPAAVALTPERPDAAPSTSGAGPSARVTDAPVAVSPVDSVTVAWNERASESAATAVVHGTSDGAPTVPAPGPVFPAELATKTPAAAALSSAACCGPNSAEVVPPIDMLMTSTPSATARSIAATTSALLQPVCAVVPLPFQHAL